jgi:hypothetical protein
MARKRYTAEEIIGQLRTIEIELGGTGCGSAHKPIQNIKRFTMTVLEGVLGLTVDVFSFCN